jgi:hypothetical protein
MLNFHSTNGLTITGEPLVAATLKRPTATGVLVTNLVLTAVTGGTKITLPAGTPPLPPGVGELVLTAVGCGPYSGLVGIGSTCALMPVEHSPGVALDSFTNIGTTDLAACADEAAAVVLPAVLQGLFPTTATVGVPYTGVVQLRDTTSLGLLAPLPAGLNGAFNPTTQQYVITGTPTATGVISPTFALGNANSPGGVVSVSPAPGGTAAIVVAVAAPAPSPAPAPAPAQCPEPAVAASLNPTSGASGAAYSGSFTVNNATSVTLLAPPAWITTQLFNPATGVFTVGGTLPTVTTDTGVNIVFNATNACSGGVSNAGLGLVAGPPLTVIAPPPAGMCPTPAVVGVLSPANVTSGQAYTGTVTTSNATAGVLNGLPPGITAAFNSSTQTFSVSGTSTSTGAFSVTANLSNACATGTQSDVTNAAAGALSVAAVGSCPSPAVSQGLTPATMTQGQPYSGALTVANATSVSVIGLPAGLSVTGFVPATGVVSVAGTPTSAGTNSLSVDATNACGGGNTSVTLTGLSAGSAVVSAPGVCPTPFISASLTPATATAGTPWSGTATFGNTTALVVNSLPAWVTTQSFDPVTGVLSLAGTPTAGANINIGHTVNLTNACGGGLTTSTATSVPIGSLAVGAAACPNPVLTTTIAPPQATTGVAYNGFVQFTNATGASATGMPAWMTATFDLGTQRLNFTGTPTAAGTFGPIQVTATNNCGTGGAAGTLAATNAGSLNVSLPSCPAPTLTAPLADNVAPTTLEDTCGNIVSAAPIGGTVPGGGAVPPNATVQFTSVYGFGGYISASANRNTRLWFAANGAYLGGSYSVTPITICP